MKLKDKLKERFPKLRGPKAALVGAAVVLLVLFIASRAFAQNMPIIAWEYDVVHFEMQDELSGEVLYKNSANKSSDKVDETRDHLGVLVHIKVEVTDGPEIITVTPPIGYSAIPDYAEVDDGDEVRIRIVGGMM